MAGQMQPIVEIDNSRQISAESILFALFGMPVEELVKEIRNDETGKYVGIIVNQENTRKVG